MLPVSYKNPDGKLRYPCDIYKDLSQLVLSKAEEEWLMNVVDSRRDSDSIDIIDNYIRSPEGLNWTWAKEYKPHNYEWCGAFAAVCWRIAGLHQTIAKYAWSSTYRLIRWARYKKPSKSWTGNKVYLPPEVEQTLGIVGHNPYDLEALHFQVNAKRMYQKVADDATIKDLSWAPIPGDIVIVGKPGKTWGNHVTVCRGLDEDENLCLTWEGNATGPGPIEGAKNRQGVIKHNRPFGKRKGRSYYVQHIIRPSWLDCIGTLRYDK